MWLFEKNVNENDDEGKYNDTEDNNCIEVDNDDNNNNEEEENNLVNDALVMDVEREDDSRDARKKLSHKHKNKKMWWCHACLKQ